MGFLSDQVGKKDAQDWGESTREHTTDANEPGRPWIGASYPISPKQDR
jgi:hypothetical protein